MEKLKIIVCGCTKNSSSYIQNEIDNLLKMKPLFAHFDIVLYENDSTDNTVDILKVLESENKLKLITETEIQNKLRHRTMIIAHGRNKLVEYVLSANKYDYMIMVDLDELTKNFNIQGIIDAFNYKLDSWDVLTSNCNNKYYDIWALRINRRYWGNVHSKIWDRCLDYDCWDMIHHRRQMGVEERILHIRPYQKHISKESNLIQVDSAFCGMGIYKISKIKNCKYVGFTQKCSCSRYSPHIKGYCMLTTCEHVAFHEDMIKKHNAKIFICPQLIVNAQTEHYL